MGNRTGSHVNISSYAKEEHEGTTGRKRVATFSDGNSVSYEDTSFTSGESPAVLDVATDLGRIGLKGHLINDGPGRLQVEVSFNGTTYGGLHTVRGGEVFSFDDFQISKIRLTYIEPTGYRVEVK